MTDNDTIDHETAGGDHGEEHSGDVLTTDWRTRLERRAHPLDASPVFSAASPAIVADRAPLMMLHGIGNNGATFAPILPVLAAARPVLAPHTNPGLFSMSDDRAATVAGLVEFLTALSPPPWRLVGHSMGGLLAGLLMRARPDLVVGAVLINSPLPGVSFRFRVGDTFDRTGRALLSLKALAQVTAFGRPRLPGFLRGVEVTVVRNALRGFVVDPGALDDDVIRTAVIDARTRDADRFLRLARQLPDWELEPFDQVPVRIVAGSDDPLLPPADLERVARAYPAAMIETLADVGHFAQLEASGATVTAIEGAFNGGSDRRRSSPGGPPVPRESVSERRWRRNQAS